MKIFLNDIIFAISSALDAVEFEFNGAQKFHAQRVAMLSVRLLKEMRKGGAEDQSLNADLLALAGAAALHDNGLTTYYRDNPTGSLKLMNFTHSPLFRQHCIEGEDNIKELPFYDRVKDAILYHHESPDGRGPFGKRAGEISLFARLIQFADAYDNLYCMDHMEQGMFDRMRSHVRRNAGALADKESAEVFLDCVTLQDFEPFQGENIEKALFDALPQEEVEASYDMLRHIAGVIARITDYKSTFTSDHSRGIASKAERMGQYYGWDEDACSVMYITGAFHDIGKLYVPTEILEKPGKLTQEEFGKMKYHALATYEILGRIRGIGDIQHWAGLHHEKLDGSGYPFGLNGEALDFRDRLLGCIDIYQALTEYRPYRISSTHEEAIEIMRGDVARGKIDGAIVEDINRAFG